MSICSLLAFKNKLNTKVRISNWAPNIDQKCVLCANHNEDREHLFFQCTYSKSILMEILPKINITGHYNFDIYSTLNVIKQAQEQMIASNTNLFSIIFTNILWNIWCERNNRVFKGIEQPFELRINRILLDSKHIIQNKTQFGKLNSEERLILAKLNMLTDLHPHPRPP